MVYEFIEEKIITQLLDSESLADCCRKFYPSDNTKNAAKQLARFCKKHNIDYESYLPDRATKIEKRTTCLYCGKPFNGGDYRRLFCDHSCAQRYHIKENGNIPKFSSETEYYCINCGKKIENTYSSKYNKFCDKTCESEYKKKETIRKWREGARETKHPWIIPKAVRDYLIELAGGKCEVCGWHEINPTTGKIPLQIHHIDGNCLNNSEENLQILCPNCHSLTPNYGSLNKNANKERTRYIETKRKPRCLLTLDDLDNDKSPDSSVA